MLFEEEISRDQNSYMCRKYMESWNLIGNFVLLGASCFGRDLHTHPVVGPDGV